MATDTATQTFFDMEVEELLQVFLTNVLDDMVEQTPSISHHTGLTTAANGYESDLVIAQEKSEKVVLPGFDMKYDKYPVGPNGEMRGGLLTGSAVRTNKNGGKYTVVPINAEQAPGAFHKLQDTNRETYLSANMLAEKAGVPAAMQFLVGSGANPEEVKDWLYEWQTGRFEGAVGESGNRTVFRTVTDDPKQNAAWWYPPSTVENPVPIANALEEVMALLGGG